MKPAQENIPIIYELIPPPKTVTQRSIESFFTVVDRIMSSAPVDAINIPEVHDESGQTSEKGANTIAKTDPRVFAKEALKRWQNVDVIVNHVVVHEAMKNFKKWVRETKEIYDLSKVILVGGESSKIKYIGPSVQTAAEWISRTYNKEVGAGNAVCLGGITIPTRRRPEPELDEPNRLIAKARSGIEFFTSQVIYEASATKALLKDYETECKKEAVEPKRIYLSFAPVSTRKDIKFLRWLGVSINEKVEQELKEGWIGMGWRSVEICRGILEDIFDYVRANGIKVPLGINVEHVMKYNVELSRELLVTLAGIVKQPNNN